jgi:hypothetical protein
MVGNPRANMGDASNVGRLGVVPDSSFFPDWTNQWGAQNSRDWNDPFKGIPLPKSRRPHLPSWFEDPSSPELPPWLRYPVPGNESPGFPSVPTTPPKQIPGPESQLNERLLAHLLQNYLLPLQSAEPERSSSRINEVSTSVQSASKADGRQSDRVGIPRGVFSGEPMQLWPVQPPIFFSSK